MPENIAVLAIAAAVVLLAGKAIPPLTLPAAGNFACFPFPFCDLGNLPEIEQPHAADRHKKPSKYDVVRSISPVQQVFQADEAPAADCRR